MCNLYSPSRSHYIYIYTHDCPCLFALYIYTCTSTCSVVLTCILPTNSYQDTLDFSINMFCVWMQRNLFRYPLSLNIQKSCIIHIIMCMWLSSFMRVLKQSSVLKGLRAGIQQGWVNTRPRWLIQLLFMPQFWIHVKMGGAVLTFTLIMFPKWLIMILAVRKSWKLLRHRVIRAAKKPMTCSFTCVSPPKHWADASEQPCVWICYSLACQTKEVAVPQRDWFASELPAEVLLKLSCSWFKIHWCNNPFGYRLEYLENACHGWLWLC